MIAFRRTRGQLLNSNYWFKFEEYGSKCRKHFIRKLWDYLLPRFNGSDEERVTELCGHPRRRELRAVASVDWEGAVCRPLHPTHYKLF